MTVRFKLINSVELDRKGRIQYWKTLPLDGALPTTCPLVVPVTCFPSDPVTDPVGGPNWTTFAYSGCTMVHPTVTNCGVAPGVTNGGFDFVVNQQPGATCPNRTTAGIYNPYPANSPFCEAGLVFDQDLVVGAAVGCSRSIGCGLRMSTSASSHHWKGYLCEINVGLGGGNPDQLIIWRLNAAGAPTSIGAAIHPWVHGDVVRFTVANFFAFNEVRVCWKGFINGVLVTSGTDFGGAQFTTGQAGFAILNTLLSTVDVPGVSSRELDVNGWTACVDINT